MGSQTGSTFTIIITYSDGETAKYTGGTPRQELIFGEGPRLNEYYSYILRVVNMDLMDRSCDICGIMPKNVANLCNQYTVTCVMGGWTETKVYDAIEFVHMRPLTEGGYAQEVAFYSNN